MTAGRCWWLQDPATGWALLFTWIPDRYWRHSLEIIRGRPMGAEPALLAWRRELPASAARDLWRDHIRKGWRRCEAQW